ncbi:MAG: hypothetical protein GF364_17495 [Candidatus Lokiarchaeota archaeon]|nr:hypothetical protein [Candidatus Lokiarchaeota archaeon]
MEKKGKRGDLHHINKWRKFRIFLIVFLLFNLIVFEALYLIYGTALQSKLQENNIEYDEYGGWSNYPPELGSPVATGFFAVQKLNNRWWFVDPLGNPFILKGMNCVGYTNSVLTTEKSEFDILNKYSSKAEWAPDVANLLRNWGFNNLGEWSDSALYGSKYNLSRFIAVNVVGCVGGGCSDITEPCTTDFFDPSFNSSADIWIKNQVLPWKDNPLIMGYFCDGELFWGQDWRTEETLIQAFFMMEEVAPGRIYLLNWLVNRTESVETFNSIWGTSINQWTDIENLEYDDFRPRNDQAQLLSDEWAQLCAEMYHNVSSHWIRKYDSNHLLFGTRYPDLPSDHILNGTSKFVDALVHSGYRWEPRIERLDSIIPKLDVPMFYHEFAWESMETGHPNAIMGSPVTFTEAQRSLGYYYYLEEFMRRPYALGFAYFSWTDGKNTQFIYGEGNGFISTKGRPHYKYAKIATYVNTLLEIWHIEGGTDVAIRIFDASGYIGLIAVILGIIINIGYQKLWNTKGGKIKEKMSRFKPKSKAIRILGKIGKVLLLICFDFCLLVAVFVPVVYWMWLGPLEPKTVFNDLFYYR